MRARGLAALPSGPRSPGLLLAAAALSAAGALGAPPRERFASCPPPEEVPCARQGGRSAALYLVGMKSRLLLGSTMEHVVQPWVRDGFAAHVYISMITGSSNRHLGASIPIRMVGQEDPVFRHMNHSQFREHLRRTVERAGGCLVCAELMKEQEEQEDIPVLVSQVTHNPPDTKSGHRLMNLWRRRERMWNASQQVERLRMRRYDFLMWAPDSSHWLEDVAPPSTLLQAPDAPNSYWMQHCGHTLMQKHPDHVIAMGREAAPALLTLYSQYRRGGLSVETHSCEEHLHTAAMLADLTPVRSDFKDFPEVDAMHYGDEGNMSLCLFSHYGCNQNLKKYGFPREKQCESEPWDIRANELHQEEPGDAAAAQTPTLAQSEGSAPQASTGGSIGEVATRRRVESCGERRPWWASCATAVVKEKQHVDRVFSRGFGAAWPGS